MVTDPDLYKRFELWFYYRDGDPDPAFATFKAWFLEEIIADPGSDIQRENLDEILEEAFKRKFLEELLSLPGSDRSLREFVSVKFIPLGGPDPFRTVRRIGGGEGRGFSQNINSEMARRAREVSEPKPPRPKRPHDEAPDKPEPIRPPLREKS
jgi:hypothetical protein